MKIAQDYRALKVSTSNGNRRYCEAVKFAAQKAKFPAFSNPEVYRDFQRAEFDMKGRQRVSVGESAQCQKRRLLDLR